MLVLRWVPFRSSHDHRFWSLWPTISWSYHLQTLILCQTYRFSFFLHAETPCQPNFIQLLFSLNPWLQFQCLQPQHSTLYIKTRLNLYRILPQKLSWNSGTLTWMLKWDSWTCPKCPLTVYKRQKLSLSYRIVDLLSLPMISCLIYILTCVTICHTSSIGKEPVPFARPFFTSTRRSATSSLVSYTAQGTIIPSTNVFQGHTTVVLVCCTIKWEPDITCTCEIEYSKVCTNVSCIFTISNCLPCYIHWDM